MNYETLKNEIKDAMRNGDTYRRDILRQVLNEVKNIEINERREIVEADVNAMIRRVLKQISETYEYAVKVSTESESAIKLHSQIAMLQSYMPRIVKGEELEDAIDKIVSALGSFNIGSVMKELNVKFNGNFDKKHASQYVKNLLNKK